MARPIFYHRGVKNVIVAFGSLFDEISIISDHDEVIKVPFHYAPKSKFIEVYNEESSFDVVGTRFTLPRMAFEMSGMSFAPDRWHNPLSKMYSPNQSSFMYARVPYDFSFNVYIATKTFEDSLRIVEQIIPYFTPELLVTMKDHADFDLRTDVPIVLNSVGYDISYEGTFTEKRTIEWTLQFTAKGFLYSDVKVPAAIKESIVNMTQDDYDRKFSQLIEEVTPREAERDDPHHIKSTINGPDKPWKQ